LQFMTTLMGPKKQRARPWRYLSLVRWIIRPAVSYQTRPSSLFAA
jgi:hypothetical protein